MAEIAASLPSWNDGPAKAAIVEFVARVTNPAGRASCPLPSVSQPSRHRVVETVFPAPAR